MKDFTTRFVSVLLAIPSMLLINLIIEYLSGGLAPYTGEGVDYSGPVWLGLLVVGLYSFPVYLILGIPVSYLVDFLSVNTRGYSYLDKLIMYMLVCIILIYLLDDMENIFSLAPVMLVIVPVMSYFHVLYFLKNRK
ncbi:hypothetical protein AUC31_01970 [Planococcus rifietoensis]|uniref:Uncharacterized protein n=1 Tax=Planococcus rifietoensis TaxID=200991 RepID=A0A0U2XB97_9BACL|nr:hypothetical protein [Planococcus rifietoensis]ALS74095.1 hypothetical protein AUC31_01970 [Planococcus rifietoensis]